MTKIEALLEIIHQARDNQKLVEAIEALLVGEESVRDSAGKDPDPGEGENGAALKQQAQKAPAEEVKAEAAPKPKKRGGKKSTVDTGRIKALRQGWWTVAEIADDVGCSQQTVRNNLQKMGMR